MKNSLLSWGVCTAWHMTFGWPVGFTYFASHLPAWMKISQVWSLNISWTLLSLTPPSGAIFDEIWGESTMKNPLEWLMWSLWGESFCAGGEKRGGEVMKRRGGYGGEGKGGRKKWPESVGRFSSVQMGSGGKHKKWEGWVEAERMGSSWLNGIPLTQYYRFLDCKVKRAILLMCMMDGIATEHLEARVLGFNSTDILNKTILCCGANFCPVVWLVIPLAST